MTRVLSFTFRTRAISNLMIRTIKYRGLIKCLKRGGVERNISSVDLYTRNIYLLCFIAP